MAYGNGKRLGETIDPRLMQADYSGFTNAAAITGNALTNIGQQIGETIKKRNENEKEIAGGIKMATAMKAAVPALGSMADEVIDNLSNADLSTNDKLLALAGVKEAMQMSLLGNQERRADVALKIQQNELAAKIAAAQNKEAVMVYTPAELDSFRKAGYDPKIVGRDQFGNLKVETMQGKGVGAGGVTPFVKDGVFGFAPQNPTNFLPTPGAGAGIQNALPQGQGGMFPDNVAPTGLPIGEAAEFTPGVSVDGTPGVLPPKEQPVIPIGEVPKSDVYSVEGGQVGVTRLPGSTAEIEYQTKAADLEKSKLEAEKIKGEAEKTSKESTKAKNNFSTVIEEATNAYSNLYKKGGAVVGGEFSLGQVLASTNTGQKFGEITGSEAQVFRNYLDSLAPKILLGIMASTGLSATQLNSNAELQLQLKSLGDPSKPIQSNIAALDTLDKMYGDGTSVSKMLSKNPKLGALMKESGFDYGKKETESTPLDTNPEVEQMLKDLGL